VWTIPSGPQCGNCATSLASLTFDGALNGSGGNSLCAAETKLFQQAVAALLNACRAGQSISGIISDVQAALNSCDRTTILNEASILQGTNGGTCGGAAPTTLGFRK
jgi:hypothetical protein